jgi:hypothetical protein
LCGEHLFERVFANQEMPCGGLDDVDLICFREPQKRSGWNTASCDRLIERQYFNLVSAVGALAESVVALIGPQNENLVALGRN